VVMISQTISLESAQHAWLKAQPGGISGTIRLLTTDAMVAGSKKKKPTKADLQQGLADLRRQVAEGEVQLRDQVQARLEAEQQATLAIQASKTAQEREHDRQERWNAYREAHLAEIGSLSLEDLKALKARVAGGQNAD
jgi:hypothetical protein